MIMMGQLSKSFTIPQSSRQTINSTEFDLSQSGAEHLKTISKKGNND